MIDVLVQYLSLDINWNTYKPEQQEEFLRDLEDLVKDGYQNFTADQKKSCKLLHSTTVLKYLTFIIIVSLAAALKTDPTKDFKTWDNLLQKSEELQNGDWKNMSLDEKKAGKNDVCMLPILTMV